MRFAFPPYSSTDLSTTCRNSSLIFWQGEIKDRAFAHSSLSPDPAAVPLDDALHNGEADAGAFVFRAVVQTLEDAKQLVGIALIKPDASILDVIYGFLPLDIPAYFDTSVTLHK